MGQLVHRSERSALQWLLNPHPRGLRGGGLVEQARSTFLTGDGGRGVVVDLADDLPANAARHTDASSVIRVAAARDGRAVAVSVAVDGAAVATELLPQLFLNQRGVATAWRNPAPDDGPPSGPVPHRVRRAHCNQARPARPGRSRVQGAYHRPSTRTPTTSTPWYLRCRTEVA